MANDLLAEVFSVATHKGMAETGGGHNQKGVEFQRAWALSRMFDLEKSGATDFLFLFEAIQDVAEMDSPTTPTAIHIYQVKKKDRGEWKWKDLTNLFEPDSKKAQSQASSDIKDSPIGKLYSSVRAFEGLHGSGRFVSNSGCDLPLANGANAATSLPCDLSLLEAKHLGLLRKGLETLHVAKALPVDPSLIYVEKIPIHPDGAIAHLKGIAVAFLDERSPRHAGQASALIDALLAKVGPLGAKTDTCSSFAELTKERGFSREEFVAALGALEQVPDHEAILNDLLAQWSSETGANVTAMEAIGIRVAASRIFRSQVMGAEVPQTNDLIGDIDRWLESNALGGLLTPLIAQAKTDLLSLHPSTRPAEFLAHFLLRLANKCVDQIYGN